MSKNSSRRKQQFPEYFEESEENYGQFNQAQPTTSIDGKPIQLIRIKPTGKMQVDPQALQIIASIDKPIGFVSIVGRAHTGKSTLLNRLLHLSNKGFQVDKTNSGGTKGIWMWSQPYQNKTFDNCIIFLDTQGTDNLIKDVEHNTKIFTLSVLLSSYFIYNSLGSIDQRTLSELQMVTSLPKNIQVSNQNQNLSENSHQLYRYMPKMLWVLRDFMLNIEDVRGKKITPNQYLQNCLSEVNTIGRPNESTKKVKKSISTFFPNRDCLAMIRPVDDQQGMYHLNSLPDYALKKEFIAGINTLRSKVMSNTEPKTYEGKNISGYQMAAMIESYVEAFNSEKAPNIKTAWEKISEDEGAAAYAKALQKYEQIFHRQFPNQEPKGDEIHRILFNLKEQTIKEFERQSVNNKSQLFLKKLKKFIEEKESLIIEQNSSANEIKNLEILRKHSQAFRAKIESNYYTDSKNKEELKRDIEEIVKKYNRDAKGEKKGEIIAEFVSFLTPFVMSTTNTEADKQKILDQIKLAEYQQRDRLREEQLKNSKKKLADITSPINNPKVGVPKRQSKDAKREKKESQGCCTGDKCQIM